MILLDLKINIKEKIFETFGNIDSNQDYFHDLHGRYNLKEFLHPFLTSMRLFLKILIYKGL